MAELTAAEVAKWPPERGNRPSPAASAPHARDRPADGVRPRERSASTPAHPADRDPRLHRESAVGDAAARQGIERLGPWRLFEQQGARPTRSSTSSSRRAGARRDVRGRRRARDAPRTAPRRRNADGAPRDPRRAHDRARRRPRDNRFAAGLGVRASRSRAGGRAAAGRRAAETATATIPHGHDQRDPALRAGAAQRRAAARKHRSRSAASLIRPVSRCSPAPTSSTTIRRSTRSRTRSARSASSARSRRAPTRGSRSAVGGGAASARASRCRR